MRRHRSYPKGREFEDEFFGIARADRPQELASMNFEDALLDTMMHQPPGWDPKNPPPGSAAEKLFTEVRKHLKRKSWRERLCLFVGVGRSIDIHAGDGVFLLEGIKRAHVLFDLTAENPTETRKIPGGEVYIIFKKRLENPRYLRELGAKIARRFWLKKNKLYRRQHRQREVQLTG